MTLRCASIPFVVALVTKDQDRKRPRRRRGSPALVGAPLPKHLPRVIGNLLRLLAEALNEGIHGVRVEPNDPSQVNGDQLALADEPV
jgi:hypothetical protein